MPSLKVEPGVEIHYLIDDYTDPWKRTEWILMHHQMGGNARTWYSWVPYLARHHRVVRIDARGHGESSIPPKDYRVTLEGFAEDVKRLLDHLGVERVHFVGASGGSVVGQHFAVAYPARLHSLALVSPLPGLSQSRQEEMVARIKGNGLRAFMNGQRNVRFNPDRVDEKLIDWYMSEWTRVDPNILIRAISAVSVDLSALLRRITVPTLILSAGADELNSEEVRLLMRREIPRLEYVVIEGRGHNIVASAGDECARLLANFLRRLRSARS